MIWPQLIRDLKITSWNVNGVFTKLEKECVMRFLHNFDVICLNEVKTSLFVSLPGFVTYRSSIAGSGDRGGTVVCIRNSLSYLIHTVDVSIGDQVWLQFKNMQGILFGFCYIPPSDSPYFSQSSFASIQEKLCSDHIKGCVLIGDMNCRFGKTVRNLIDTQNGVYSYPVINDDVNYANDNAELLAAICRENDLVVINNLKAPNKHFKSNKTFRRAGSWISELDTCIASREFIGNISEFCVYQRDELPSDHAPISVNITSHGVDLDYVFSCAVLLGGHAADFNSNTSYRIIKKPLKFHNIDKQKFSDIIAVTDIVVDTADINVSVDRICASLYACSEKSVACQTNDYSLSALGRWERLLEDRDDSRVWMAIDWKGNFGGERGSACRPSDEEFKVHFESIYNPSDTAALTVPDVHVTIPVLDNDITYDEVTAQIKKLKPNKACGPDGLSPGIFSLLPVQWILYLVSLFNNVFISGIYPVAWVKATMSMIFKKGDNSDPNNYRGISIANAIAKLYDMVICERLYLWFKPYREQAGAQKKRGCMEHIVTLRLLIDTAKRKKYKLFVTFIDFSKAYDMVPRQKLFDVLKRLGCGMIMLASLIAMYSVTECIIGSAVVSASIGVRQGLATSCFLFVIYVNELIRIIKAECGPEGYLGWLHVLMLMDDAVLLATSRENMIRKLKIVSKFCDDYGMKFNVGKTKYFVINGTGEDMSPICVNDMIIERCNSYLYLGSPFTSDGLVTSAVKEHAKRKLCHVMKFVSFIKKNNDIPFIVKRRVFDAVLMSSLLYGCESWIGADLRPVVKLYNWAMKALLGVRKTTPNIVCYAELGYPTLPDLVRLRQHKFLNNMWMERHNMHDDPLNFTMNKVISLNTNVGKIVETMTRSDVPSMSSLIDNVHVAIRTANGSRCNVYKEINPDLGVHSIYKDKHAINDLQRISFTRFRLSGHSLAIETGRWNRRGRGRLPIEERLCECGLVQTERHVVEQCHKTQYLRNLHGIQSLNDLFCIPDKNIQCRVIHDILKLYN